MHGSVGKVQHSNLLILQELLNVDQTHFQSYKIRMQAALQHIIIYWYLSNKNTTPTVHTGKTVDYCTH
jgi:hypothetical protein